ncbi:MAG: translation initiation factor IF-2 [Clostridia bacterium]|nr:translation initiation factor IF-2 [Clostridia bacterium]
MMIKYKLQDVAKDFGKSNKELISLLAGYYDEPKRAATALDEKELDIVFDRLTQDNSVQNFDAFFAIGEEARKAREAEKEAAKAKKLADQEALAAMLKAQAAAQNAEKAAKDAKPTKDNKGAKPAPAEQKPAPSAPVVIPPREKKVKKEGEAPRRTPAEIRKVDTRTSNVNLDRYNEKYTNLADDRMKQRDYAGGKQKIKQKSQEYRKPQGSKRETEADKLRRIQLEKIKKMPLKITVGDEITVGDLAQKLKKTAAEVIKQLMMLGVMATVTQTIDFDTAELVATELGAKVEREVVVTIEERIIDDSTDDDANLKPRDPVVVVMGHVDHGKTSILDAIRHTNVTSGEAGGITQHIGAYKVKAQDREITFLDTPGHAAFTSMRARGAQVTDIAVLVVAADDGIMPQTIEAINHAKAANVQIIVAINKMDKPTANPDRIMQQLTEHELVPEEWGGDVICVPVSALTGKGISDLLDNIILVADMMELKANPDRAAKGNVIEARLDKGRGPVATVLVKNGTLHTGDVIVAGMSVGRVRAMTDDKGRAVKVAGPSTPVEITGLDEVPEAGDVFDAVSDERLARELIEQRKTTAKEERFNAAQKVTLDNLFEQMQSGEMKELRIIVKADVQGSAEAVKQSLEKLTNEEVRVAVIHTGVGAVNESDVMLANSSNAIIVGFNVRPDANAKQSAERDDVQMKMYRIIYDCIEEVQAAMKGMLAPKTREVVLGNAQVRQVYKISSVGTVAGCYITDGKVTRASQIRVVRDGIVIAEDKIDSLRRFKDDVKEVAQGFECGIGLDKFNDIKEGDVFEAFIIEEYRED